MTRPGPESSPDPASLQPWNFHHVAVSLIVGAFFQLTLLPCLCATGDWRLKMALYFDLMILLRMAVAYFCHSKGNAWMVYVALCYTSGFWLYWLTSMILRFSGRSDCS